MLQPNCTNFYSVFLKQFSNIILSKSNWIVSNVNLMLRPGNIQLMCSKPFYIIVTKFLSIPVSTFYGNYDIIIDLEVVTLLYQKKYT